VLNIRRCVGCGGTRMLRTTWSSGKVEAEGVCWLREGRGDFKLCSGRKTCGPKPRIQDEKEQKCQKKSNYALRDPTRTSG